MAIGDKAMQVITTENAKKKEHIAKSLKKSTYFMC